MPMRATFQEEAWQWMGLGCHSNCRFILGKAARHRSSPTAAAGAGGSAGAPAPGRMGAGDPRLPGSRALPSITRRRCGLDPRVGVPPRLCSVQAGPHRCHQRPLQQQGPARELPVSSTWQRHRWKRTPRGCSSTLPSPAPPPPCKERGNPSSSWGLGAFGGAGIPGTTLRGHPQPQHLPRAAGPAQGGPRGCPQGRREPPGLTHGAPVPGHLPFCLESSTPFSCFEKLFIKKCSKLSREILRHLAS